MTDQKTDFKTEAPADPAPLALKPETTKAGSSSKMKVSALIGAVLGLPASYWFQNEMVRAKLNLVEYTAGIFAQPQAFAENGLYPQVIAGVVVCGIIGAVLGRMASK